jgi:ActR/RegA family two-component response regulator
MERRGFVVTTAASVAAGIAAASERLPALDLVDVRLNDASGLEVLTALRKARPGTRIMMLTVSSAPVEGNAGTRKVMTRPLSDEISAPHAEVTDLLSLFLENVQTEETQDRCELTISGIIDNYGTIGIAALEARLRGATLEPLFWKFLTALGARRGEPTDG